MKKIFFPIIGVIGVVAIAVVMSFNVNKVLSVGTQNDLLFANIEALAGCESGVFTDWGREVDLTCNTQGGAYTLKACDFDTG